jgi:hypothetical protein
MRVSPRLVRRFMEAAHWRTQTLTFSRCASHARFADVIADWAAAGKTLDIETTSL